MSLYLLSLTIFTASVVFQEILGENEKLEGKPRDPWSQISSPSPKFLAKCSSRFICHSNAKEPTISVLLWAKTNTINRANLSQWLIGLAHVCLSAERPAPWAAVGCGKQPVGRRSCSNCRVMGLQQGPCESEQRDLKWILISRSFTKQADVLLPSWRRGATAQHD